MKIAYLSLGSNIGDRQANLNRAIELIEDSRIQILKKSSRFLTEPRELVEQPWFLNQCVEIQTTLFPLQLLARILGIEREMGRKRLVPKGPRVIDMDILLYGSLQVKTEKLQIPHPRMKERRFVLEPLAEIAPALRIGGMYVRDLLRNVEQQVVKKLECKKEPGAGQAPG